MDTQRGSAASPAHTNTMGSENTGLLNTPRGSSGEKAKARSVSRRSRLAQTGSVGRSWTSRMVSRFCCMNRS